MYTACNTNQDLEEQITDILKKHFYFSKAHRFLKAGEENRLIAATEAYRKKRPWEYSFSLEAIVSYERQKPYLDLALLDLIKDRDSVDSPRLREYVKNQIHQTT